MTRHLGMGIHMEEHQLIKCFLCTYCCISESQMKNHIRHDHLSLLESINSNKCMDKDLCFTCEYCDFITYINELLEHHTKANHPGKRLKCMMKMLSRSVSAKVRQTDALFYVAVFCETPELNISGEERYRPNRESMPTPSTPDIADIENIKEERNVDYDYHEAEPNVSDQEMHNGESMISTSTPDVVTLDIKEERNADYGYSHLFNISGKEENGESMTVWTATSSDIVKIENKEERSAEYGCPHTELNISDKEKHNGDDMTTPSTSNIVNIKEENDDVNYAEAVVSGKKINNGEIMSPLFTSDILIKEENNVNYDYPHIDDSVNLNENSFSESTRFSISNQFDQDATNFSENISYDISQGQTVPEKTLPLVPEFRATESFHCLYCHYSHFKLDNLRIHLLKRHPTYAAVVTKNSERTTDSLTDVTFLCVRKACFFSTNICSVYENHLMTCCLIFKSLSVNERLMLISSFLFVLDFHKVHCLIAVPGFLYFVSTVERILDIEQAKRGYIEREHNYSSTIRPLWSFVNPSGEHDDTMVEVHGRHIHGRILFRGKR